MNYDGRAFARFRKAAWAALGLSVLVIAWGAFVRATGSGAGCGEHWPTCNGNMIPRSPRLETLIELSHRLSSGILLITLLTVTVWAYRRFPKGHALRQGATLSLIFVLLEAAIGAGLVLLSLVAHDASALRAVSISAHLFNTFLLLASMTYLAWSATKKRSDRFCINTSKARAAALFGTLALFAATGIAGAIVALGDTLFPAASLREGIQQDLSPTAHFLLRLRVFHPILALLSAAAIVAICLLARAWTPTRTMANVTRLLTALVVCQIALGTLNLLLLAPIWLQLLHLIFADATWIALVIVCIEALRGDAEAIVLVDPAAFSPNLSLDLGRNGRTGRSTNPS